MAATRERLLKFGSGSADRHVTDVSADMSKRFRKCDLLLPLLCLIAGAGIDAEVVLTMWTEGEERFRAGAEAGAPLRIIRGAFRRSCAKRSPQAIPIVNP